MKGIPHISHVNKWKTGLFLLHNDIFITSIMLISRLQNKKIQDSPIPYSRSWSGIQRKNDSQKKNHSNKGQNFITRGYSVSGEAKAYYSQLPLIQSQGRECISSFYMNILLLSKQ